MRPKSIGVKQKIRRSSRSPRRLKRVSSVELVQSLLEENDMTGDDLAKLLDVDRSVAYKMLKGSRNLTAAHIRAIADRFLISADALIQ